MAAAAVIGLSAGKRLLSSSFYYSDISEKLYGGCSDLGVVLLKNVINARKSSNYSTNFVSSRETQSIKAVKEHVEVSRASDVEMWIQSSDMEDDIGGDEFEVDALLLLQKSMLEKQWNLESQENLVASRPRVKGRKKMQVTGSGISARRRRIETRKRVVNQKNCGLDLGTDKEQASVISPNLLQNHLKSYVKGVLSRELLTHAEVVQLSKIIKTGLYIDDRKARYVYCYVDMILFLS